MMHVVCLSSADCRLLCARYAEHGNSIRRMIDALREAGASDAAARMAALRRVEREFDLDLAEICHRHAHRHDHGGSAMERLVVDFVAEERINGDDVQLWVMPGRVRQIRELMDGKLVGDLES
ncbi:MAG TPA: hypothetical protein VK929_03805 [Longimicrobiales bacterium]|nr:hypothetical protein [Longimicrobiales bacterium]